MLERDSFLGWPRTFSPVRSTHTILHLGTFEKVIQLHITVDMVVMAQRRLNGNFVCVCVCESARVVAFHYTNYSLIRSALDLRTKVVKVDWSNV